LKNQINEALIEEGLTGAVWSVVDSSGKISFDAVGLNNKETGKQLKPTDKVHIGSITKTLIATGVLRLATEKKLDLNEPVEKYLLQLSFENPWKSSNPITIRHLLDHTSGLTDIRLWQIFSEKATADSPLEFAFKQNPKVLKIHTKPGSMFSYSNMGYTLLAMIIESVTKERYESYLDKNLLLPLGMTNSTFQFVSQVGNKADKNLAFGHLDNQVIYSALPMYLRPAGQLTTTSYDMAIFAKFLMSDGKINGKEFISQDFLFQMGQPQNTISKQKGLAVGYGLGTMTRDRHGYIGLAHSGNIVGYHAMFYWFPKLKKAFFISHNMDSETANYERFNEMFIKYLKLDNTISHLKTMEPKGLENWKGYYLPVFSKVEPFAYFDILSSYLKVAISDSSIIFAPFQKPEKILHQVSEKMLISDGKIEASHLVYKDEFDKVFITDGFSTYKKVSGYYLLGHWISFILGSIGLLFLLLSGIFQAIRSKRLIFSNPIFPSFLTILILLIPIPFFYFQSFAALGDKTFASILLFISTCFLPLGLMLSVIQYLKNGLSSLKNKFGFTATVLALQWVFMLFAWGLIPFRLWV
jgi:CubicO group peptidase (beta-lactamase class C family)